MSMDNIKAIIETTLKAEVVKALNNAPDAIEKLITAALSKEVDKHTGSADRSYYGDRVPYLDFLIGDEIRGAAREAVREVFASQKDTIKAAIKARFSAESIVESFADALVKAGSEDWRIQVNFEGEKKR